MNKIQIFNNAHYTAIQIINGRKNTHFNNEIFSTSKILVLAPCLEYRWKFNQGTFFFSSLKMDDEREDQSKTQEKRKKKKTAWDEFGKIA